MSLEPNRPHENFFVLQNRSEMENRRAGSYRFKIREIVPKYYSGLQVNKDPGVPLVWTGCAFMIVGFYLTFFLAHRRLWVRLSPQGGDTLLEIAGSSHRNRLAFEQEFARMVESLQEKLLRPGKHSKEREEQA
jgi:cytochrome c biogenesis protein